MGENSGGGIVFKRQLDHFAWVNTGFVNGAGKDFEVLNNLMLVIEQNNGKNLLFSLA